MRYYFIQIVVIIGFFTLANAQGGFSTKGSFKVHNNFNGQGILVYNNYLINGVVQTQHTTNPNKIIFAKNAKWQLATPFSYIDGYVKTKSKKDFLFPVGNKGMYKPLGLESCENATVSYQRATPMSNNWVDSVYVKKISTTEYWTTSSEANSNVTLFYDKDLSGLQDPKNSVISKLTIVAWDGYAWISIPSKIDEFIKDQNSSVLKPSSVTSDLNQGSITSTVTVPMVNFSAFTLGLTHHNNPLPESIAKITGISVANTSKPNKIALSKNRDTDFKLLKKIHFSFNDDQLSKYSTNILTILVDELRSLKGDYRLKLVGHTDIFGSDDYNYTLGLRRAESIKAFLLQRGIANVGVEIISEGKTKAAQECLMCKASEMITNRRVDIYLIEKK